MLPLSLEPSAERRRLKDHWPMSAVLVRPVVAADRPVVDAFLAENHSNVVARLGELVDPGPRRRCSPRSPAGSPASPRSCSTATSSSS